MCARVHAGLPIPPLPPPQSITDHWNVLQGVRGNPVFIAIIVISCLCQIFMVEVGGNFVKATGLSAAHWGSSIGFALITMPLGFLMRQIPVADNPEDFATTGDTGGGGATVVWRSSLISPPPPGARVRGAAPADGQPEAGGRMVQMTEVQRASTGET